MSSICSSVSYRMDSNFLFKAMRIDEAICETEHNSSDTDSDKSSLNDVNLHI